MSLKYIIQQGDTLSQIAERLDVDMLEIAKNNNIKDVNKIYTGRTLTIPSKAEQEKVQIRNIQEKIQEPIRKDRESDSRTIAKIKPEVSNLFASAPSKPTEPLFSWEDIKEFFTKERPDLGSKANSLLSPSKAASKSVENPLGPTQPPVSVDEEGKKELSSTAIPSPIKYVWGSLWGKGTGQTRTGEDVGEDVVQVTRDAKDNAIADGRLYVHYEDYGETNRGLPVAALVGAAKDASGRKLSPKERQSLSSQRRKAYPKNPIGAARLVYDLFTDPKVKAALTIGGFSIRGDEGGEYLEDVFNFNTANSGDKDWYAFIRKVLSNSGLMPIDDNEGIKTRIELS